RQGHLAVSLRLCEPVLRRLELVQQRAPMLARPLRERVQTLAVVLAAGRAVPLLGPRQRSLFALHHEHASTRPSATSSRESQSSTTSGECETSKTREAPTSAAARRSIAT